MAKIQSVAVFCGSFNPPQAYRDMAQQVGTMIGQAGLRLVYGGSTVGLMGICANAVLDAGGEVTGVIPTFLSLREPKHPGVTELIEVEDMHTRKRIMVDRSDAFIILPGGFGTLDELAEIMTWRMLRLHNKPIVLLNFENYWEHFRAHIEQMVKVGFIREPHRQLVTFHDDPATILDVVLREGEAAAAEEASGGPGPAHDQTVEAGMNRA